MIFTRWRDSIETGSSHEYRPLTQVRSHAENSDLEKNSLEENGGASVLLLPPFNGQKDLGMDSFGWKSWMLTFINTVVLSITILLFFASQDGKNSLNRALKELNWYSSLLEDVEIPIVHKKVRGHLFPAEDPGDNYIGRLEPGPATDELWEDFEVQRSFVLSREQVIALGKDPDMSVKYPDEDFGLGDEAYMGALDIFHVLHCFNAIRQEAFKDYYWDGEMYHMEGYGEESKPKRRHSELWWLHMRHCVDIVVQSLTCNADPSFITMTWLESQDRPWMDFSVNKKCVDWEAITKWRDLNALDVKKAGSVKKPEWIKGSDKEVKIEPLFWRLYGNETTAGDYFHHPLWDIDENGMPMH